MKVKGLRVLEFGDCLFSEIFPPRTLSAMASTRPAGQQKSPIVQDGIIFHSFLQRAYETIRNTETSGHTKSIFSKLCVLMTDRAFNPQQFENWYRLLVANTTSRAFNVQDAVNVRDYLQKPLDLATYEAHILKKYEVDVALSCCEQKRLFMAGDKIGVCWPDARVGDQLVHMRYRVDDHWLILRPRGDQFVLVGHAVLGEKTPKEWDESRLQSFELV